MSQEWQRSTLAREDVWQTVNALKPEQLTDSEHGRWSVLAILEHLWLTEESVTNGIKQAVALGEPFTRKNKPMEGALDRSNRLQAPDGLRPRGTFHSLSDARSHLDDSRRHLHDVLQSIPEDKWENIGFRHPFLGRLSVAQWTEFVGLHERRHIAQIEEGRADPPGR